MQREILFNPYLASHGASFEAERAPYAFHRKLPGYTPTPLLEAPSLAHQLNIGRVWVKCEQDRLGLPAFKILGASWATYRALEMRLGTALPWTTLAELRAIVAPLQPMTLAAATDGNHGRAVARVAHWLGFDAHIFVPLGTSPARIAAIRDEGATVTVIDGTYDDAVARSAAEASSHCLVISDTSWPGYEDVPRAVIDGYSTMCWEVQDQLAEHGAEMPDLIAIQMGVGALAAAVVRYFRRGDSDHRPVFVGVEPLNAACVLRSIAAGHIVEVAGPHDSIMAGLNCGQPSLVAWPTVSTGIDLFVAVDDERARIAMRSLAAAGIVAGETGAAGLAGIDEVLDGAGAADIRERLRINRSTSLLIFVTEGATDPQAYQRIVRNTTQDAG